MATDEQDANIPLAEVLRAANSMVSAGLIADYALGGALAAIYYIEPFATYDERPGLSAGIPAIYAHLQTQGWQVESEHLILRGFPVQFLAAHGLTEEAVRQAEHVKYEGVPAKIFRAEHIGCYCGERGPPKRQSSR